jgi:hypothetical protein
MRYDKFYGPVPTVGIELEVLEWKPPRNYKKVQTELAAAGYMPKHVYTKNKVIKGIETTQHTYHCACNVCSVIGKTLLIPVQWKMEYDNSLPPQGAEYISSPFPLTEPAMFQVMDAFEIISKDAIWSYHKLPNRDNTKLSSAGMHVHVRPAGEVTATVLHDIRNTYNAYYPELLAIASSCNKARGLFYRHGMPGHQDEHHYFLSMNQHNGAQAHLEWRLGEADYGNFDYFSGQIFLYAALTSAIALPPIRKALHAVAVTQPFHSMKVITDQDMPVVEVLQYFNMSRFEALRKIVLDCSHISVMPWAREVVEKMFQNALDKVIK